MRNSSIVTADVSSLTVAASTAAPEGSTHGAGNDARLRRERNVRDERQKQRLHAKSLACRGVVGAAANRVHFACFPSGTSSSVEVTVRRTSKLALAVATVALIGSETSSSAAFQAAPAAPAAGQGRLIVYGDVTTFYGVGKPENCVLRSRFKRGEPVGFRMFVADPSTGKREESAQLVVHLTFAGTSLDLPMRYRGTVKQPEREFWVAKWVVTRHCAYWNRSIFRHRDRQIRPDR